MNLKDLELEKVKKFDETIENMKNQRKDVIANSSKENRAYHSIKDYIKSHGYVLEVRTVLRGYEYVMKGEHYSCSVDTIVRNCRFACKTLIDAGYCN